MSLIPENVKLYDGATVTIQRSLHAPTIQVKVFMPRVGTMIVPVDIAGAEFIIQKLQEAIDDMRRDYPDRPQAQGAPAPEVE